MNDIKLSEFLPPEVITKKQLEKIVSRLPELIRVKAKIGHSTSQTSYALQTLAMLDDSPMSRMKQCISNIEHKYQASREACFKIEKLRVKMKECFKNEVPTPSPEMVKVLIREADTQIEAIINGVGNAMREIGMFQDYYDAIRISNKIPENWTEKDFEEQEIGNMIRRSFRLAIQDISATGRVSRAAVEFWEQLGIHPQLAATITQGYLQKTQNTIAEKKTITVKVMYDFLDQMVKEFKDCYTLALKRIGLEELGSEEFRI